MNIKVHTIILPDGRELVVNPGTDGVFVVNKPTCVDDYGDIVAGLPGRLLDTYVNGPTGGHYSVFGDTQYGDYADPVDLATDAGRAAFIADDCGALAAEGFLTIYDYLTGQTTVIADLYPKQKEEWAWAQG